MNNKTAFGTVIATCDNCQRLIYEGDTHYYARYQQGEFCLREWRRRRKNMRQIDRNDALNIVYNAARAIEDLPITDAVPVIRCEACANWDKKSGLTARRCAVHGHVTKRLDYCSYGMVKDNAVD